MPSYSEAQIKAAFATCKAHAEEVAETEKRFLMPTSKLGELPFAEQLETCVLWTLRGILVEMTPLD